MNDQYLRNVIEAALLAAGKPLAALELRELFDEFERPEVEAVQFALNSLSVDYEHRGIELREVASGWRIQVRESVAGPVSRLWQERPPKYSRAFLETLALIAYRQPITRGEIEEIRGVAVNPNIVKTLMERGWIRVVGHREVPGRPELLGTTREFLDYFGLKSLDDLPTLAQLRDIETLGVQLEFGTTASPVAEAADVQSSAAATTPTAAEAEPEPEPEREVQVEGDAEAESTARATVTQAATDHEQDPDRLARDLVAAGADGTVVREPRD